MDDRDAGDVMGERIKQLMKKLLGINQEVSDTEERVTNKLREVRQEVRESIDALNEMSRQIREMDKEDARSNNAGH